MKGATPACPSLLASSRSAPMCYPTPSASTKGGDVVVPTQPLLLLLPARR